jgi:hypothetical protein
VSTSSHSEQRSQARQSRWYCGKTWESRSVPNLITFMVLRADPSSQDEGFFAFRMFPFYNLDFDIPTGNCYLFLG